MILANLPRYFQACGFEILYQESKNRSDASNISSITAVSSSVTCILIVIDSNYQDEARKEALGRDPEYIQYIENLRSSGYFKAESQGSEVWKLLENKAVSAFVDSRREE